MIEARNNGIPLIEQAPKAAVTQAILALAEALSGDVPIEAGDAPAKKAAGRFFGLWPGKRS